ncbi:hypothetical protein OHD16_16615 [Sphingobacterium sp. ML3W]|uniref:hypothetical protein n=1 Tax=Sphingobacterium sp. ML3W TaxID=1538644 RepID=UPI00249CA46D|nr:hypothetical protein [Sphingobacterium sp. ML3W]WFA81576.1 hypothetical protein OGI71_09755 [Sphingobacterium sp. ML3W]
MKRILNLTLVLLTVNTMPTMAAQQATSVMEDKEVVFFSLNAIAVLLSIWIASSFLLKLVKLFLNDRLRRTLIERNAPLEIVTEILPKENNIVELALSWCCVLFAGSVGLTLCYFTQPLGFHSAIILSMSLAFGLLVYYFIRKHKNQS